MTSIFNTSIENQNKEYEELLQTVPKSEFQKNILQLKKSILEKIRNKIVFNFIFNFKF